MLEALLNDPNYIRYTFIFLIARKTTFPDNAILDHYVAKYRDPKNNEKNMPEYNRQIKIKEKSVELNLGWWCSFIINFLQVLNLEGFHYNIRN